MQRSPAARGNWTPSGGGRGSSPGRFSGRGRFGSPYRSGFGGRGRGGSPGRGRGGRGGMAPRALRDSFSSENYMGHDEQQEPVEEGAVDAHDAHYMEGEFDYMAEDAHWTDEQFGGPEDEAYEHYGDY